MAEHTLKTLAPFFDAVADGSKTFEVRKNDRGFAVGDILVLTRFLHSDVSHGVVPSHPPRHLRKRVSYVLAGGQYGIDPDYCVLGMQNLEGTDQ